MNFGFGFFTSNSSNGSYVDTLNSTANNSQETETTGALACLFDDGGFDCFGSKDMFGSVDFANMGGEFVACSSQEVETIGSMACAVSSCGVDFAGASSGGDFSGGASGASAGGGDCGGGGGSFSSVC